MGDAGMRDTLNTGRDRKAWPILLIDFLALPQLPLGETPLKEATLSPRL
jgi:hypothetical protein